MASRRDDILARVQTLLAASGGPVGLTVTRFRTLPVEAASLPAIGIYPLGETAERVGGNRGAKTEHALTVRLECRVGSTDAAIGADTALDPLYQWVIGQLFADETLGPDGAGANRALYLVEKTVEWDASLADREYAVLRIEIEIHYATLAADVTVLA